jgi:hypothetical protein
MGYQITANDRGEVVGASVSDDHWAEIIYIASEQGHSAPYLRMLNRGEQVRVSPSAALELDRALGKALDAGNPSELVGSDDLDRDTVNSVRRVLRARDVKLARTPPWKSG